MRLYEIQVTVIYSHAILVAVTSECRVKRVICKNWTGTLANRTDPDQTPQNAASNQRLVCVEVLRPSQPNGVMSSAFSLPNHTFTGQA